MPPRIDPNAPLAATGVPESQQVAPPPQAGGPNLGFDLPNVAPEASAQLLQAASQAQMQQQLAGQVTPQEDLTTASFMAGFGGLVSALRGSPAAAQVGLNALDEVQQRNLFTRQAAQGLISRTQDEVKSQEALKLKASELAAFRRAGMSALADPILSTDQRTALQELMAVNPKEGLDLFQTMRRENRLTEDRKWTQRLQVAQFNSMEESRKITRELGQLKKQDILAGDYSELTPKGQRERDLKAGAEFSKDKNDDLRAMGETMIGLREYLGNDFRGPQAQAILKKVTGNWEALYRGDTGAGTHEVREVARLLSSVGFQEAFRRGGKQLVERELGATGTISGLDVSRTGAKNAFALNPEMVAKALIALEGGVQSSIDDRAKKYMNLSPTYAKQLDDEGSIFVPGGYSMAAGVASHSRGANLDVPPEYADDAPDVQEWKSLPLTQKRRKWAEFYIANPGAQPPVEVDSKDSMMDILKRPFNLKL